MLLRAVVVLILVAGVLTTPVWKPAAKRVKWAASPLGHFSHRGQSHRRGQAGADRQRPGGRDAMSLRVSP
jgi:hypothetical protein